MPPKGWKNISVKTVLLNKLEALAKTKEMSRSGLIHMILWGYVDKSSEGE